MPRDVGAVVVAAGRGVRAGGATPKQYRLLAGQPMVLRTLRAFLVHDEVAHVALVLPPQDVSTPPPWLAPLLAAGRLSAVPGGAERGDSAAAGLAALPADCAVVLVHDGARPFVSGETISAVAREARRGACAVAAVPVSDTLKETDAGQPPVVVRTVSRERLWRAQTPQGFPRALLEEAYAAARRDGIQGTDDAALAERLGVPVCVVPDSALNFKVTTADDVALAELLAARAP